MAVKLKEKIILDKNHNEVKKPTRYYSNKQEKTVANNINGRQSSNSGATMFDKSDVSTDKWVFECKTKTSDSLSISVKKEWIDKNKTEAIFMGKPYSAVVFNFGPNQDNFYIIDENTFKLMLDALGKVESHD